MASKAEAPKPFKHTTSIGKSSFSRPKSKHAKRMTKPYRGQGKPS